MRAGGRVLLLTVVLACSGCGKGSTAYWIEQLRASEPTRRIQAVHTLHERRSEAAEIVPALTGALKDENTYVRRDAARALGAFGDDARSAVPALRAGLHDREPSVRKAAAAALARIEPQRAPPQSGRAAGK